MVMMLIPVVTLTAFAEVAVEDDQLYIWATDEEGQSIRGAYRFMDTFEYGNLWESLNIWEFIITDDGIKGNGYQMIIDRDLQSGDILPKISIEHFDREALNRDDTYIELMPALYDCVVLDFQVLNDREVEQLGLLVRC